MGESNSPCVVAIGASAGGLAAFQELIENLPTDTGMAFVLLSHLLRGFKSLLPEILSRSTKMSVIQVTDRERRTGLIVGFNRVQPTSFSFRLSSYQVNSFEYVVIAVYEAVTRFLSATGPALSDAARCSTGCVGIREIKDYAKEVQDLVLAPLGLEGVI